MNAVRRRRLLEEIFDDAFDVDPFILDDFPFYAYYELISGGGGGDFVGSAPVWWPANIYDIVHKHPFWQGKFPHERVKKKKRAHPLSPQEKKVLVKENGVLRARRRLGVVHDEIALMELILSGEI